MYIYIYTPIMYFGHKLLFFERIYYAHDLESSRVTFVQNDHRLRVVWHKPTKTPPAYAKYQISV